jgi:ADP-ribosyl-[dinitrogen reductase] hydrolase
MQQEIRSRFRGCLLGLAIGDALGMPVEGARASSIRSRLGRVTDFLPAPWRNLQAGQWTDDTKMMLCHARSITDTGRVDPSDIACKFMDWMDGRDWRGMGNATYSSIKRLREGIPPGESGETGEMAAGNGSAMRIAPVALLLCRDLEALRQEAETASIITHNNPEAVAGSRAVSYAIARMVQGEVEPDEILAGMVDFAGPSGVSERLSMAGKFLAQEMDEEEALVRLGTSGYVVETVASAMFCVFRHQDDFEEAVIAAVNAGLDADTTGAIAGTVSGARNGLEAIPERWASQVEASVEVLALADRIFDLAYGPQEKN